MFNLVAMCGSVAASLAIVGTALADDHQFTTIGSAHVQAMTTAEMEHVVGTGGVTIALENPISNPFQLSKTNEGVASVDADQEFQVKDEEPNHREVTVKGDLIIDTSRPIMGNAQGVEIEIIVY